MPQGSYRELAELEKHGQRVLVARLLQVGDLRAAGAILSRDPTDKTLDNERGVLALQQGHPQEAINHFVATDEASSPTQTLWNRALALRDMQLPFAAAGAFDLVAARKEAGWSAEARDLAKQVVGEAEQWNKRFDKVMQEGYALVSDQKVPSEITLTTQRDFVRLFFYDAVRSVGSPDEAKRLSVVASRLDQSYGGQELSRYLSRVSRLDFVRRRPLAERYRKYVLAYWQIFRPKS